VTLAVVFKGPEGIALAADSRITLTMKNLATGKEMTSFFDNATKLLSIQGQDYVGIVTSGQGAIGATAPRTAHGFIPEFEEQLGKTCNGRAAVADIATELGKFYREQWIQAGLPVGLPAEAQQMQFLVAGFDPGDAYGRVFKVAVPDAPDPVEQVPTDGFGMAIDGQTELAGRILGGFDPAALGITKDHLNLDDSQVTDLQKKWTEKLGLPIPYQFLPLQDCVDLSVFLVTMTSAVQSWTTGLRGVGGEVDVATITRTQGFRPIRQKKIQVWGESDD
jgi:hypothetical protein